MFTAAVFAIAKIGKPPKCLSTGEWIKEMWYRYTVEYYSAIKNEILPFATIWMDLEYNANRNKPVRERQMLYDFTHMWNLRSKTNEQREKKRQRKK